MAYTRTAKLRVFVVTWGADRRLSALERTFVVVADPMTAIRLGKVEALELEV